MRDIKEIKNELSAKLLNLKAETDMEKRSLLASEVENITRELNDANVARAAEQAAANNNLSEQQRTEVQQFSFSRFMQGALNGGLSGFEKEMAEEAKKEARSAGVELKGFAIPHMVLANKRAASGQNVTNPAEGGNLIQESGIVYIDALRAKLILDKIGATGLTGLIGDLPLVKGGQFAGQWLSENGTARGGKVEFAKTTLKPKRLVIRGAYSKQLLIQSSMDVEKYIMEELIAAHAVSLNAAVINGSGTDGEPLGILNMPGIGAVHGGENGAKINWANLVGLETEVSIKNADMGNLAYFTNSKVRGQLKITEKSAGTARFLMENGEVNGYNLIATNLIPSNLVKGTGTNLSALIFGNGADVVWGQWAGLDILLDPYTLADDGDVKVIATAFHDFGVKNVESFSAIKDIITD